MIRDVRVFPSPLLPIIPGMQVLCSGFRGVGFQVLCPSTARLLPEATLNVISLCADTASMGLARLVSPRAARKAAGAKKLKQAAREPEAEEDEPGSEAECAPEGPVDTIDWVMIPHAQPH